MQRPFSARTGAEDDLSFITFSIFTFNGTSINNSMDITNHKPTHDYKHHKHMHPSHHKQHSA